ncbi:hypothetical protein EVAR_55985_1 [Eumeta japonica]|uniref:Uncharacterized protein n=1 Tax=Eumeta variegata TaxID=151549 RepID=A0A4C1Y793_EUMVA|nr:hypothetical protein EVAR_55985_1 [Eumeta japonica]
MRDSKARAQPAIVVRRFRYDHASNFNTITIPYFQVYLLGCEQTTRNGTACALCSLTVVELHPTRVMTDSEIVAESGVGREPNQIQNQERSLDKS